MRMRMRGFAAFLAVVGLAIVGQARADGDDDKDKAKNPEKPGLVDSWDAVFLQGSKVGHVHTFIEPVTDKGRKLLRVRFDMTLNYKRLKDTITVEFQYGTIETLDGEVLRLDTRTVAAETVTRAHGDVVDGKMNLNFQSGGPIERKSIPWGPDVRGPYAAEQSMARKPMEPGEVRELKMFQPELNEVCGIKLTAVKEEEVELGGGTKRTLLRVEQTTMLSDKPRKEFDYTLFVDSQGQVIKSHSEVNGGMDLYRTTREGALAAGGGQFDQITHSVIKVPRPINNPERTRNVRYKVKLKGDAPATVIPDDRRQSLTPSTKTGEATLVVKTAGRNTGPAGEESVDPAYLRANALVDSKDPRVVELTQRAIAGATEPWDKATRIEKWVFRNVTEKNFKTAFAPSSEVARNLAGDCTEHSVLTAAMCRAAGVPARVAVGLLYVRDLGGFGYHMWNEVYVNRRWVALDATVDQEDVDAVHIKLKDTSLEGVSPFEAFLPIVTVLGKLSIEPVEIR